MAEQFSRRAHVLMEAGLSRPPASPRLACPARGRAATRHQLAIPRRARLHDIGNRPNGRNAFQRRIDDRINLTRHSKAALSPTRSGKALQLRSEEHTSELQSLMRISYAVFCLKKKKKKTTAT